MLLPKRLLTLLLVVLFITTGSVMAQSPGSQGTLPDNVDTADCTSVPPAHSFNIKKKWKTFHGTRPTDPFIHGRSTPLVADLNGDGHPEVIVPMSPYSDPAGRDSRYVQNNNSALRPNTFITKNLAVIDGGTGEIKYTIQTCDFQVHGQPISIADIDNDGKPEIVILSIGARKSGSKQQYGGKYLYCYDATKANTGPEDCKWKSKKEVDYIFIPMIADINNDGYAEIVVGNCIFNFRGDLLVEGKMDVNGMGFGGPHNVHGGWQQGKGQELGEQFYLFSLADIDGDNQLEICAGNSVYKATITNIMGAGGNDWKTLTQCETGVLPFEDMYDGQTITLDFDNDGDLDVCVIGRNKQITDFGGNVNHIGLYVWEGQTSKIIGYFVCDQKTTSLGIPFAGDLNGDGYPAIIANGWVYGKNYGASGDGQDQMHVFEYKEGYKQDNITSPGGGKAMNIKEPFNRNQCKPYFESAGFTVFDFNQDGKAEIVFRGEKNLYILDGSTLTPLCAPIAATSGTTAEYPVIADVDCDGHADILFTEEYTPASGPGGGLSVYESETFGAWAPARRVWNQWPYNVVNINEDMTVPKYQFNHATGFGPNNKRPFNSFLQQATKLNAQGEMFSPAADVALDQDTTALEIVCDTIKFDIKFRSRGTEPINGPHGIVIYKDNYQGEIIYRTQYEDNFEVGDSLELQLQYTPEDLAQFLPITQFVVTVNDMGDGIAFEPEHQNECDTTNNYLYLPFSGFITTEYDTIEHHMCVGDTFAIGTSRYTLPGDYVDTLVNRNGCDSIVTSHIFTHSISVDLGPDQRYCSKDYSPVVLDIDNCTSPLATSCIWQDSTTERRYMVDFEGGDFKVTVYDEYGCSDSDSVTVTVIRNPEVYLTKDPEDFCENLMTVITAHSSVDEVDYLWNTGATSESITVAKDGGYAVTADNDGCTGTASIIIPACPCEVWIPNAFSPNSDGLNDVFRPNATSDLDEYHMTIFNRWGELIFTADDITIGWDGKYKGEKAVPGVYTYTIFYICSNSKQKKMKHGSITLIR